MGYIENLMGTGVPAETARVLGVQDVTSAPAYDITTTSLTATGTTIADALQLTRFYSNVGTTALNTGVKLPSAWPIGQMGIVYNGGANALNLYPPTSSDSLLGKTAGSPVTIAAGAANLVIRTGAFSWVAYVLAIEA